MNLRLTYTGKVTGDHVKIHRSKEMHEMVVRHFAGKEIEITVQRKSKRRSLMQNAYYWGVVLPMVCSGLNDAGYKVNLEATHEYLKATFNKKELVNESTGEILSTVGSTTQMSTSEMCDYFAEITQWSAEYLNIQIPAPNEQIKIEL